MVLAHIAGAVDKLQQRQKDCGKFLSALVCVKRIFYSNIYWFFQNFQHNVCSSLVCELDFDMLSECLDLGEFDLSHQIMLILRLY